MLALSERRLTREEREELAPDMDMGCGNCDWEGDDSMVLYEGFEFRSRYTWWQVEQRNINVEAMVCPVCDSYEVEPTCGW